MIFIRKRYNIFIYLFIFAFRNKVKRTGKLEVKTMGSTHKLLSKLLALSSAEVGGIPGVAVECVDIGRNTSGEGDLLGTN